MDYIENLQKAGVEAEADIYPKFYHAYDMMEPETKAAQTAAARFVEKFKEAKAKYFTGE